MSVLIKSGYVISNTLAYPIARISKIEEVGGVCEITFDCGKCVSLNGHLADTIDKLTTEE